MKRPQLSPLASRMLHAMAQYAMALPGQRLAVGVSGGADSVALLHLLLEARAELGVRLSVAHFNHKLRGAAADADEAFVRELAAKAGLECVVESADVAAAARASKQNLEAAARRIRDEFFQAVQARGVADRVAVAHTADDQAETVLARLLRGTGARGLASIYPVRGIIVRPLLDVRRAELRAYLAEHGLAWREDETNRDPAQQRARIRQRLLPLLEAEFQPRIVERLCETARLARLDEAFWNELLRVTETRWVTRAGERYEIPATRLLRPLPDELAGDDASGHSCGRASGEVHADAQAALAGRLIYRLAETVRVRAGEISARHVSQVLALARNPRGGKRVVLPGGVEVARRGGILRFAPSAEADSWRRRKRRLETI